MNRDTRHEHEAATGKEAQGISNRESPEAEAAERKSHPPVQEASSERQDAADDGGEPAVADLNERQTSAKVGSRSLAQKEAGTRYADRSMPATRKVAGAFGRELGPDGSVPEPESDREQPSSK